MNFKAKTLWPSRILYLDKGRGGDGGQNTGKKKQNGAMVLQFQSENLAGAFPFLEPPKVKENLFFLFFKKKERMVSNTQQRMVEFCACVFKKGLRWVGGKGKSAQNKKNRTPWLKRIEREPSISNILTKLVYLSFLAFSFLT